MMSHSTFSKQIMDYFAQHNKINTDELFLLIAKTLTSLPILAQLHRFNNSYFPHIFINHLFNKIEQINCVELTIFLYLARNLFA